MKFFTILMHSVTSCHSLASKANSHSSFCQDTLSFLHNTFTKTVLSTRPRARHQEQSDDRGLALPPRVHNLRGREMCHSKDTMQAYRGQPAPSHSLSLSPLLPHSPKCELKSVCQDILISFSQFLLFLPLTLHFYYISSFWRKECKLCHVSGGQRIIPSQFLLLPCGSQGLYSGFHLGELRFPYLLSHLVHPISTPSAFFPTTCINFGTRSLLLL